MIVYTITRSENIRTPLPTRNVSTYVETKKLKLLKKKNPKTTHLRKPKLRKNLFPKSLL